MAYAETALFVELGTVKETKERIGFRLRVADPKAFGSGFQGEMRDPDPYPIEMDTIDGAVGHESARWCGGGGSAGCDEHAQQGNQRTGPYRVAHRFQLMASTMIGSVSLTPFWKMASGVNTMWPRAIHSSTSG